jgi:hypothetical protein
MEAPSPVSASLIWMPSRMALLLRERSLLRCRNSMEAHCAVRPKEYSAGRGSGLSEQGTRDTTGWYTSGRGGPDLDEALGLMQLQELLFRTVLRSWVLQLLRPSFT